LTGATYMSPDLIGEVRFVVAPVDAEMGRGNGQFQFLTRSGSNEFHGAGVWTARNTAFDANTWANNRAVDPKTGIQDPKNFNTFENYLTFPNRVRDAVQSEGDIFVKDDWKVFRSFSRIPFPGVGARLVSAPWKFRESGDLM